MRIYTIIPLAMLCLLILLGCKSKKIGNPTTGDLYGKWNVIEMSGQPVDPKESGQFIQIDPLSGHVSGFGGCNNFGGEFEVADINKGLIRFLDVMYTKKGCMQDYNESTMMENIRIATRIESIDQELPIDSLIVYGVNGESLFVLSKK